MRQMTMAMVAVALALSGCGGMGARPTAAEAGVAAHVTVQERPEGAAGGATMSMVARVGDCRLATTLAKADAAAPWAWKEGPALQWRSPDNGGWNRWTLFTASRREGGQAVRVWPGPGMPLLERLATGERAVVDLAWAAPAAGAGQIGWRVARFPGDGYLYCELYWTSPGAAPTEVALGGYPHSTAAGLCVCYPQRMPGDRQRWVDKPTGEASLAQRVELDLAQGDWGLVLFNRCEQEECGLTLVFLPEEVASASCQGNYGVGIGLQLRPEATRVRFALGEFIRQDPAAVRRAFREGEARRVQEKLRAADWDLAPDLDERLLAELADLGRCPAVAAQHEAAIPAAVAECRAAAAALAALPALPRPAVGAGDPVPGADAAAVRERRRREQDLLRAAAAARELRRSAAANWLAAEAYAAAPDGAQ